MRTLLLPRNDRGYYMQEECCYGRDSAVCPSLAFHVAARTGCRLWPWEADCGPVPPAEDSACILSWVFGDDLERVPALDLIANPSSSMDALIAVCGARGKYSRASDYFSTDQPLPFDALAPAFWWDFRKIIYQYSSGCPWACKFCVWAHKYKLRDPVLCAEEVSYLSGRVNYAPNVFGDNVMLLGNEITGKPSWLRAFCGTLARGIRWSADMNVRNMTHEDVMIAAHAGCRRVCLGIEFLTDSMLERLGKGHTVQRALSAMRLLQEEGISYRFSIRHGVGETVEDVEECLGNLRHIVGEACLRPDHVYVGPMVAWPGSGWTITGPTHNCGSARYPRLTAKLTPELQAAWAGLNAFVQEKINKKVEKAS